MLSFFLVHKQHQVCVKDHHVQRWGLYEKNIT